MAHLVGSFICVKLRINKTNPCCLESWWGYLQGLENLTEEGLGGDCNSLSFNQQSAQFVKIPYDLWVFPSVSYST